MIEEGYIKYKQHFTKQSLKESNVIKKLSTSRKKMFDLGLIGAYNNGIGFGNISMRAADGLFIISATQTGEISELEKDDFAEVYDYNVMQNEVWSRGMKRASSESLTHAAVYELDKAINSVIHIHSPKLWKQYKNQLPTTSDKIAYGTPEMAKEVARLYKETDLKTCKIFVMGGHEEGIIAFGENLDEAERLIESL